MRRVVGLLVVIAVLGAGCRRPRGEPQVEQPRPQPAPPVAAKESDTFALQFAATEVSVIKGSRTRVKVNAVRKGYNGPISLEVKNLPENVSAQDGLIKPDTFSTEIELTAAGNATPGKGPGVQIEATALMGGQKAASSYFTVTVLDVPFALRLEPSEVKIQQGSRATLKVSADRKSYQGPIVLEVRHLPSDVTAAKAVLPQGQRETTIELSAAPKASEGQKNNVQVAGSTQGQPEFQATSPKFTVSVLGPPFLLITDADFTIPYGAKKAKVKVNVQRRDYKGPIDLSLVGLPGKASQALQIPENQNSGEFELNLSDLALLGKNQVHVVGNAAGAPNRQATSPKFIVNFEGPPFDVRLDPPLLPLPQGAIAMPWKVNVTRRNYDGPIKVELKNLPKNITATSATIFRGQNTGKLDISVADDAPGGDRAGISAVATAIASENKEQVAAAGLALRVLEPVSLTAQPASVQLIEGGKGTIKVSALRRTYQGPIELSLKNLPEKLVAGKAVIPEGKDSAEIEVSAPATAPGGARSDVQVVGLMSTSRKVASNAFTVNLQSKLFELKARPELVVLQQGEKAYIKVSATRRNYQGAIAVELRNLPMQVSAAKDAIPAGQTETEIEISAGVEATTGTKADVHVLGIATAGGNQQVASPPVRMDVKPGLYDLKVEPSTIKLTHGSTVKFKVVATRKGYKGPINLEIKNLPKDVKATPTYIPPNMTVAEVEISAATAAAEGDFIDAQARGSSGADKAVLSPRFTIHVASYGQEPVLEVKTSPAALKLAPGSSTKVQVTLARKKFDGPVNIELKNLPAGIESSKATIDMGQSTGVVTLTASPKVESGTRPDVCAVATAILTTGIHQFASPQITIHVGRK